jgi:hypothetical protein
MYENAQYVEFMGQVTSIRVDIDGVTSFVPLDPANTDYANLMELEREGKIVIQPADGTEQ